jgi:hypothetical protein
MSILKSTHGLLKQSLFWYTYKQWKNQSNLKKSKDKESMVSVKGQKLTVGRKSWQKEELPAEKI